MIIHIGVIDLPYTAEDATVTTGDVAIWIEKKYHVMEVFYEDKSVPIAAKLADEMVGHLENLMLGAPVLETLTFPETMSFIGNGFKKFLSMQEIERFGIPGVPTRAALEGVNNRLKTKKGPRRPSFIDTGLYQSAAIAWVSDANS